MGHEKATRREDQALGADIEAMILDLGLQVSSLEPINILTGTTADRSVFRLRLTDGSSVKARRFDDPSRAEIVSELSRDLDHPAYARVLAQRGGALIEEWIPGQVLSAMEEVPDEIVRACGVVLGQTHRVEPSESRWGALSRSSASLLSHLRWVGQQLFELGCISHEWSVEIDDHLCHIIPDTIRYGFVHQDLARENVILQPDSTIRIIDNANFDVFPCDLDIARTFSRWPLAGQAEKSFMEGYRTERSPDSFYENFQFWMLAVCLKTAWFRGRTELDGLDLQFSRLSELLETLRVELPNTTVMGAEVEAMIGELGLEVSSVRPDPGFLRNSGDHSISLVRTPDNQLVKAHTMKDPDRAQRIFDAARDLNHPAPTRILARRGKSLIEEWIPGRPLSRLDSIPIEAIQECGSVLGEIHQRRMPESRWGPALRPGSDLLPELHHISMQLCKFEYIDVGRRDEIDEQLDRLVPSKVQYGFAHQNLSPAKVIWQPDATIRITDTYNFAVVPCDLDVARTFRRWPLVGESETAFMDGYRKQRSTDTFRDNFLFWSLDLGLRSIVYLHRCGASEIGDSLSSLVETLARIDAGTTSAPTNSTHQ